MPRLINIRLLGGPKAGEEINIEPPPRGHVHGDVIRVGMTQDLYMLARVGFESGRSQWYAAPHGTTIETGIDAMWRAYAEEQKGQS